MFTKKENRALIPGVRRLFANMIGYADLLANAHPLVIATTPTKEKPSIRASEYPPTSAD